VIAKTVLNRDGPRLAWLKPLREQETARSVSSQDAPSVRTIALKVLACALLDRIEELERTPKPGEANDLHLADEVQRFESAIIRSALITTGGRQRPAARLLGMKSTTIHAKIGRYKIDLDELKGD
jgi:DNA-binding NtrC family response regulator